MSSVIERLRNHARTPADAIRWACVLEATAPKAGNVYPGQPFCDVSYSDFVTAAEIAADRLADTSTPISRRMLNTIENTISAIGSNVNLGIVLLLGPLVAADELMPTTTWPLRIAQALDNLDGETIYRAINRASAGGLGDVDAMDVHATTGAVDILAAMRLAADHDRLARQYATGFTDLCRNVVPVVAESIEECDDVLCGVSRAHLRLLAEEPDSLIARKNGIDVAEQIRDAAGRVDVDDPKSVAEFDQSLRSDGNPLNPGTTADLIAASLFILLRDDMYERESE